MTNVRHAARGLLLTPTEEVLLMRMAFPWNEADVWILPGGGIEPGESALQAVVREVYEEVGHVDADVRNELWRREFFVDATQTHFKQRYFLVPTDRFEPRSTLLLGPEADWLQECRWWPLGALLTTEEDVDPPGLGERVQALIANGPPEAPIELTG